MVEHRLVDFDAIVYRVLDVAHADDPCAPARHVEGRFHHDGQSAVYTSLTQEGATVAIARYVTEGDPDRLIVPLRVTADRILDVRGDPAASVVWQATRATGAGAPTWLLSDAARTAGAQGMLYSSRSRPDLSHLVVFDASAGLLSTAGLAQPWTPDPKFGGAPSG